LVDDDPGKRDRVSASLRDPTQKNNRDHVDIIIALGMAKEGFDWIWCEHALTIGYRSSLAEIVQSIGRATRDATGKLRARFTNLIAESDASKEAVTEAVNDTLKAIAARLGPDDFLQTCSGFRFFFVWFSCWRSARASLFVNWEGPRFAVALPKPPRARGPPARIPL
jgi:hypothetical protein